MGRRALWALSSHVAPSYKRRRGDASTTAAASAAADEYRSGDYFVRKRRYSAFFGTDLEILLRGLGVDTLVLIGGLTDVCVHYTFVDGHQHDYFVRVIDDAVGGSSTEAHTASLVAMEYLQSGALRSTAEMLEAFGAYSQQRKAPHLKAVTVARKALA
jgi:nicotinamidase-related amidase